jgi:hypothetical protein
MADLYHRRVFEAALMLSGDGKDLRNILAIIRGLNAHGAVQRIHVSERRANSVRLPESCVEEKWKVSGSSCTISVPGVVG